MTDTPYRFYSLPAGKDVIMSLVPQIARLSQRYGLPEGAPPQLPRSGGNSLVLVQQLEQEGFLGCPLSATELSGRLRFIDSFHVAVSDGQTPELAGYCYGYSEASCRALLEDAAAQDWEERELFDHGAERHDNFSVNFQVAVDPAHVGHGLGTRLASAVTQEVAEMPSSPCLLWVLLYPFNRMGFRVATKCSFRLARTFASAAHDPFIWGELELQTGNGY